MYVHVQLSFVYIAYDNDFNDGHENLAHEASANSPPMGISNRFPMEKQINISVLIPSPVLAPFQF